MQRNERRHGRLAVTLAATALLAACGGGGGGSSTGGGDTLNDKVVLTTGTGDDVSVQAYDAAGAGSSAGGGVSASGKRSGGAAASPRVLPHLGSLVQAALGRTGSGKAKAGVAPQSTVGPTTRACSGGGTTTTTADVGSDDRLGAGDTLTVVFNDCEESYGTVSGQMDLTVVSYTSTLVIVDAVATDLTTTVGRVHETVDGDLRVRLEETSSTTIESEVSSDRFDFVRRLGSSVRATRTMLDYDLKATHDSDDEQTSTTFSYTVSGDFPRLGEVSWDAQTTRAIVTPDAADFPASGRIEVTGADDAALRIDVTDTGLTLSLDDDGDGTVDETTDLTWDEVDALR